MEVIYITHTFVEKRNLEVPDWKGMEIRGIWKLAFHAQFRAILIPAAIFAEHKKRPAEEASWFQDNPQVKWYGIDHFSNLIP